MHVSTLPYPLPFQSRIASNPSLLRVGEEEAGLVRPRSFSRAELTASQFVVSDEEEEEAAGVLSPRKRTSQGDQGDTDAHAPPQTLLSPLGAYTGGKRPTFDIPALSKLPAPDEVAPSNSEARTARIPDGLIPAFDDDDDVVVGHNGGGYGANDGVIDDSVSIDLDSSDGPAAVPPTKAIPGGGRAATSGAGGRRRNAAVSVAGQMVVGGGSNGGSNGGVEDTPELVLVLQEGRLGFPPDNITPATFGAGDPRATPPPGDALGSSDEDYQGPNRSADASLDLPHDPDFPPQQVVSCCPATAWVTAESRIPGCWPRHVPSFDYPFSAWNSPFFPSPPFCPSHHRFPPTPGGPRRQGLAGRRVVRGARAL